MPTLYCVPCGAKNDYQGVKPKTCRFCDASTDPLKNFKPATTVASAPAAQTISRPARPVARKINRWGSDANVIMSQEEMEDVGDGETLESIGIDQRSFAAKVEGDTDNPVVVVDSAWASQGGGFVRPALSKEQLEAKQDAMKHMLKGTPQSS